MADEIVVYHKEGKHLSTDFIDTDSKEVFLYNPVSHDQKGILSRSIGMDAKDSLVSKRGSLYQSSEDICRIQKDIEKMRNAEKDLGEDVFLPFEVVNSLPCCLLQEAVCIPQTAKEALMSLKLDQNSSSLNDINCFPIEEKFLGLSFQDFSEERSKISISADSILQMCLQVEEICSIGGKEAHGLVEKVQLKETKSHTCQSFSAGVDANIVYERDSICIRPKFFSAEVRTSNAPHNSKREILKSNSKPRFSPFKMLNPIVKSESLHNPLLFKTETCRSIVSDAPSFNKHKIFPKSLINDFSRTTQKIENARESIGSDQVIQTATSPAHLHAVLRWESYHGAPLYEFSVKDPEDILCAKTWNTENAFNWAYTFHCCKKKYNSRNCGTKNGHDQLPPMIGQMQVSCYTSSEGFGSFDNSTVTEFILYDIALARRNAVVRSHSASNSNETGVFTIPDSLAVESSLIKIDNLRCPVRPKPLHSEPSNFVPWKPAELSTTLEIASIVIQIPFKKKDSLKNMQANVSETDQARVNIGNLLSPVYMKVLTPSGRHGLPNSEEYGPSSLVDRWRFGGGCDCGGWDMGCPILVLENGSNVNMTLLTGTQQPILLFVKGKKEKVPALTITDNGKKQYAVDFHAQLTALQAFSICVAILHGCQASSAFFQENDKHKLHYNSLKYLLEDDAEGICKEGKRKGGNRFAQVSPSFSLDPPFSPMGRV